MSGILTVKTKVVCGEHIEQAAKEMGLTYKKDEKSINVQVSSGSYGNVSFNKDTQGMFTATGDDMLSTNVKQFVQACNVVAVRTVLQERGMRITSEPGLRNLKENEHYRIQAMPRVTA